MNTWLSGGLPASGARLRLGVGALVITAAVVAGAVTSPGAAAISMRFEAEDAGLVRATVQNVHPGYTGAGFVDFENVAGGSIEWTVDVPAGQANLSVTYANGSSSARATSVTLDDRPLGTLTFLPTSGWSTWRTMSLPAVLTSDRHRIRMTATSADGGPNVDSLTVDVDDSPPVTPPPTTSPASGPSPGQLSIAVVESAMRNLDGSINGSWSYPAALFLHGEYRLFQRTGDRRYLNHIRRYVDRYVDGSGRLRSSLPDLDSMRGGTLLIDLYVETGDARYRRAAEQIRARLDSYPRTRDGGFEHALRFPNQLWSDGVFMVDPFLAGFGSSIGDRAYAHDEAARQLEIYYAHLARPDGLLWHAYDESSSRPWARRDTGTSAEPWCRAIGWFAMASVDILDELPADHPRRPALVGMVRNLAVAFRTYQDPGTGRWFQVVDKGNRAGNWTETSCSSMYTYMLSRGVQRGYLDPSFRAQVRRGYAGVIAKLTIRGDGSTSLSDISIGTEVGDYDYYVNRPRRDNDLHGLGAFLLMTEQVQSAGDLNEAPAVGTTAKYKEFG